MVKELISSVSSVTCVQQTVQQVDTDDEGRGWRGACTEARGWENEAMAEYIIKVDVGRQLGGGVLLLHDIFRVVARRQWGTGAAGLCGQVAVCRINH